LMSPATLGTVPVAKLKFTLFPLHIVDGVVSVRVMAGAGSTTTSIAARATPEQFEEPCNFGVKTNRTVAASAPLLISVPVKVAAPAVKAWFVKFAKAVPVMVPAPLCLLTVTSHLISPGTLGVMPVVKLKLTLSPLHIVDGVVNVRVMAGVGSTITSIAGKATPGQLGVPSNFGVNAKRTVAASVPVLVNVPFKIAAPAIKVWFVRLVDAVPPTTPVPPIWVTDTSHLMLPATLGNVTVPKLKFTRSPLHIVDGVVNVRVIVGVGSTTTSIAAKAIPGQFDEPCSFGVNTKRTTAASLPLFSNVPFKVAAPAVKAWFVRLLNAVPVIVPLPLCLVTVTSHLISPIVLGDVTVAKLKFTKSPLHIVDGVVNVRAMVGVGSTTTSI
jgi:hypothetical protein